MCLVNCNKTRRAHVVKQIFGLLSPNVVFSANLVRTCLVQELIRELQASVLKESTH